MRSHSLRSPPPLLYGDALRGTSCGSPTERVISHKGTMPLQGMILQSTTGGIGYVGVCNFYTIE